jgi:hypothetical protein
MACSEVAYMQSISLNDERSVKLLENEEDLALLQGHLKEVIEGEAFRGSHRSGQFLKYVVEQAIAKHFDSLKERVIGVELFGRSPSYDTGDDAIVRVTASDVRKRLLQHYGMYGATSRFRISLPLGSYIPEISHEPGGNGNGNHELQTSLPNAVAKAEASGNARESIPGAPIAASTEMAPIKSRFSRLNRLVLLVIVLATALNLGVWGIFWKRVNRPAVLPATILPWSVFLDSPRAIHLITSDPDIAEVQQYIGGEISTSDYANGRLIPNPDKMAPEVQRFWNVIVRDDKASFVDAEIAVRIAEMAQAYSKRVNLSAARNIQISDLQTDDNYIFLGSPRSDPWSALFSDQLDFQFIFDPNSGQEVIRNLRPKPHEALQYVPTALGGATGQSYAIIAFVQNPDHNGQVLLLAGADAEGTEAAGRLITDMPRLAVALRTCGDSPGGSVKHFELLLKLNTMAGSPNDAHVEACHILGGSPSHL